MPDFPPPKLHAHPASRAGALKKRSGKRRRTAYAELQSTTNFTFLTGASHPEEVVERAAALGLSAVAVTDRNTLGGVVRAHVAAQQGGVPLVVGCRLDLFSLLPWNEVAPPPENEDVPIVLSVLVYPTDKRAYATLCRLLTLGKRRAPKGRCYLTLFDVLEHASGLLAVVLPPDTLSGTFLHATRSLKGAFDGDRLSLATSCLYGPDDRTRFTSLAALSKDTGVPLVATNDVHYHVPERRALQDVLTCVRHGLTIDAAGFALFPHGERHVKPPSEMGRLFAQRAETLTRSVEIADRASGFSLESLRYQYPDATVPPGRTEMEHLQALALEGAMERFPEGVPEKVVHSIRRELEIIDELAYAPYFLTVHDLVQFARNQEILCQGRGAAANSAVCYCLGITAVDPSVITLLFERFVSKERNEPPDIDIDFEHERREEVIQYVYRTYGRDRAALTAEVITYRGRSAVRDVGKAMGLSLDLVDRLAKQVDWFADDPADPVRIRELGLDPDEPGLARTLALAKEVLGFPRHRSQHVGGFVITKDRLSELVPIENCAMEDRTVIEWDKDDISAMNMLKVDMLSLGMLTAIRKALDFVNVSDREVADREVADREVADGKATDGKAANGSAALAADLAERTQAFKRDGLTVHTLPPEDPAVYDMVCKGDTVGVFQIESRAQMAMLPRLRPRCFYDLVIEVAIVRPGPIHGGMVHPYLRRRNGEEAVESFSPEVDAILGKTLGVPLFQEQAMALAVEAAGFTPGEADALRRAMAAWKRKTKDIQLFGEKLVHGMLERGYPREFAERCFKQIQGFSEYGFPESHAASFGLLVYISAWLKLYYPAAFTAALLNSQPMGFYAPAQLVKDAQDHGVLVREVDVNKSDWDSSLEYDTPKATGGPALRLGMRLVRGLAGDDARRIRAAVVASGPFSSPEALHRVSGAPVKAFRRLASADAFRSMGLERQQAQWRIRSLKDEILPLFAHLVEDTSPRPKLPPVPIEKQVVHDYATVHLSLKAHPMSFLRERLESHGAVEAGTLRDPEVSPHGKKIEVGGLVLNRQRPATAKGIVFMTLEDETGVANLIVRPNVFEQYRKSARHATTVLVKGQVERKGDVVHVMVHAVASLDGWMRNLLSRSRDFR